MQGQVDKVLKITQEAPKTSGTKIKGPFWPYSLSQVPGYTLIWRALLEDQTKAWTSPTLLDSLMCLVLLGPN